MGGQAEKWRCKGDGSLHSFVPAHVSLRQRVVLRKGGMDTSFTRVVVLWCSKCGTSMQVRSCFQVPND